MGTSNFGKTNLPSGTVYAIATDRNGDEDFVSIEIEDTIENVKVGIGLSSYMNREYIGNRRIIGYVNIPLFNKSSRQWEDGSINVTVEYGYYEGARLDIDLEDLYDNFPQPFNKLQEKIIAKEIKRIEQVFSLYTTQYRKVGSFSNGEGLYEKV